MATSYYKLSIEQRIETKSRGSKLVRKNGFVPGVLYYSGEENENISIEKSTLSRAIQSGQRIFEITRDGDSQYTMIKEMQYHPVTDEIMHIDLMRVRRSEKMIISVPIHISGDSIGVREGGILSQALSQVEISCYPTDVPENIAVNIANLQVNQSMSVGEIKLDNDDIEIISDSSLNVVSINPPVSEEQANDEEAGGEDLNEIESEQLEDGSADKSQDKS